MQGARPFDATFKCYRYTSFQEDEDARVETWEVCNTTDPNIPRPMDCVCGDTCVVNACVNKGSGDQVRCNMIGK